MERWYLRISYVVVSTVLKKICWESQLPRTKQFVDSHMFTCTFCLVRVLYNYHLLDKAKKVYIVRSNLQKGASLGRLDVIAPHRIALPANDAIYCIFSLNFHIC
jgi:hypothetical protein